MVNSKQKGSKFEREVCVALSRWVTDGKRDDCFWRSAMSGGRATVRGKQGKRTNSQLGDISAVSDEGHAFLRHFIVECKHVKNLSVFSAFTRGTGDLFDFWTILKRQCRQRGKQPLLIAKQNLYPALAFIKPESIEAHFGPMGSLEIARLRMGCWTSVYQFKELLNPKYEEDRFK